LRCHRLMFERLELGGIRPPTEHVCGFSTGPPRGSARGETGSRPALRRADTE
jgi:hypothetical protein